MQFIPVNGNGAASQAENVLGPGLPGCENTIKYVLAFTERFNAERAAVRRFFGGTKSREINIILRFGRIKYRPEDYRGKKAMERGEIVKC